MSAAPARPGRPATIAAPLSLTLARLILGPVALFLAFAGASRPWFAAILFGGMISDYLDGVVARALGVAYPWLRRLDSLTDLLFYLFVLGATFVLEPGALFGAAPGLLSLLLSEIACLGTSLYKFGRLPATHCYSAKLYGLTLFAAFLGVLCLDWGSAAFWALAATGLAANTEVLVILLLARHPPVDIPTLFALAGRQGGREPSP